VATVVTKDSITVRYLNWPPKTFPVCEALARGQFQTWPRIAPGVARPYTPSATSLYRLTDVKVGDWVNIRYARIGGKDVCDHISINKRPGGKVPPLPEEAEDLLRPPPIGPADPPYIPYHEKRQAYWDCLDEGIPIPAHFPEHWRKTFLPKAPPPRPKL
jgi:hypothetical protein